MTETEKQPKSVDDLNPPEEFYKIINDFITDILTTFPEYKGLVSRWWNRICEEDDDLEIMREKEILFVFRHCVKIFPERFFDILYKNEDMFKEESELTTEFLPGIVFKQLWSCEISDITRETIWKYLQLILFSVIGTVHTSSDLGDTAKLFEAINEDELKKKLSETLEGIQNLFETNSEEKTSETPPPIPNAEQLHEHINSLMEGKLGKLAMELAEETAKDLNLDMENVGSAQDVFQTLFKNPNKMMGMVKNIGSKIDEKIKSGEIKESELMEEGMDLLNKMKNMPGMGNMEKIFSQMGLGKGAKMNMGAMEAQMNKNMKAAKMKERMRSKIEAKTKANETQHELTNMENSQPVISEEDIIKIFSTGETVERTPRGTKPPVMVPAQNNNPKKKKGKK